MNRQLILKLLSVPSLFLLLVSQDACKKDNAASIPSTVITVPNGFRHHPVWDSLFFHITDDLFQVKYIFYKAGLDTQLKVNDTYILLAPNNSAFQEAGLTSSVLAGMSDRELEKMFMQWLIPARTLPNNPDNFPMKTASGDSVFLSWIQNIFLVNGIIAQPDQERYKTSNFSIIPISKLLKTPTINAFQLIQSDTSLSFFGAAVSRASKGSSNLADFLSKKTVTIFAPSNNAFRNAGYRSIQDINQLNPDELASLIKYHVLEFREYYTNLNRFYLAFYGFVNAGESTIPHAYQTMQGTTLNAEYQKTTSEFGDFYNIKLRGNGNTEQTNFIETDLTASNGVVHTIDKILQP